MKKTISAPVLRGKKEENQNDNKTSNSDMGLKKTVDLNNIVVMRGTARRKPLEEKRSVKLVRENIYRESFMKLRAPFHKPYQKCQTEEKVVTKSCEVLFECIKPYKNISIRGKVTKSVQMKTPEAVCERTAIRKVQFLSFCEETPGTIGDPEWLNWSEKSQKTVSSEDFITDAI